MSEQILIVDGYNIIGAWEDLKELKVLDMGSSRDQLISTLAYYTPWHWTRIIVVFDGQSFDWDYIGGVEIVFTDKRETADTMIERLAAGMVSSYHVEVATSDFAEYRAASAMGAVVLSAGALKEKLAEERRKYDRKSGSSRNKGLMLNDILNKSVIDSLERLRRS
ncbi:MAG: NYN domain-containing protein [Bacillota bacterium]|nr:NYN domain-containing protein [Bacillota bacterium]